MSTKSTAISLLLTLLTSWPALAINHGKLTVLQINDVYEIAPVDKGTRGGLAHIAAMQQQIRAKTPNTIFVLPGDFISPSVGSQVFRGQQMIESLNAAGVDLATLGNHEFDFGPEVIRERMKESKFTYVLSNVLEKETGQPFGGAVRHLIRDYPNMRVGFFGLLMPETSVVSNPGPTVLFTDPFETAKTEVAELRKAGCDVIIALTHQRMDVDRELARQVPGIDLITGGHEHDAMRDQIGDTLIVKTGSNARNLGRVDLSVDDHKAPVMHDQLIPVTNKSPLDAEVAKLVNHYEAQLSVALNDQIASTTVDLDLRKSNLNTNESGMANLIADIFREKFTADIAMVNGGSIRTDAIVPAGPLTVGDFYRMMPFEDLLIKVKIPGKTVLKALEHSLRQLGPINNSFPHLSGVEIVFDPKLPVGKRIIKTLVAGEPLELERSYTMVIDSYMLQGGDGFDFKNAELLTLLSDSILKTPIVLEALRGKTIGPRAMGRCEALLLGKI